MINETKDLLMAEMENDPEGVDTTLATALESLEGGYEPYDNFPREVVKQDLEKAIKEYGPEALAESFVNLDDWKRRAKRTDRRA